MSRVIRYAVLFFCFLLLIIIGQVAARPDAAPPAKTFYLSIPACAFDIGQDNSQVSTTRLGGEFRWFSNNVNLDPAFFAPVYLPQGSKLKSISMYCIDDSNIHVVLVELIQERMLTRLGSSHSTRSTQLLASLQSTDYSSYYKKYQKAITGNQKIDNSTGIYYLRLHMPQSPDGFLHDVRIGYTKRITRP